MLLRLLIGLATAGTVAGAATAFALTSESTNNTKNQENTNSSPEVRGKETETRDANERGDELEKPKLEASFQLENPELKTALEEKSEFIGKLVFSRVKKENNPGSRLAYVVYNCEIFNNDQYTKELKKWEQENKEDSDDTELTEDKEAHITIDLISGKTKKTEQELKEYLKELNQKIEKQTKGNNPLEKLEKSLEEDKNNFEENFGQGSYNEFLIAINKTKR